MKKSIALLLSVLMIFGIFAACTDTATDPTETYIPTDTATESATDTVTEASEAGTTDAEPIRVAGMKGPTSIGMVKIMKDNTSTGTYDFTIAGTADEIAPKLIKGELDIAAVPANLASVLYNKTNGAVSVLAINTLGVLYIVEKGETVQSLADLKGKTIYATGKGTTPEYSLRYLLTQNGIDPDNDVTIEFRSEATEIVSLLASAENGIAMLPQPYVTVASQKVDGLRVAVSLNDEWNNPKAVTDFLDAYKNSVTFVNENVETAAEYVEEFEIFAAAVAKKAIPQCNIVFMSDAQMKDALQAYLTVLHTQNPASIGGALPGEEFYR